MYAKYYLNPFGMGMPEVEPGLRLGIEVAVIFTSLTEIISITVFIKSCNNHYTTYPNFMGRL